jgi:hypothetical protein
LTYINARRAVARYQGREVIMAAPILDILMFAVVLSGTPTPMACEAKSETDFVCSGGINATWDPRTNIASVGGTPVYRQDGKYKFGNNISGSRNSFGWTVFSNGMMVRHDNLGGRPDAWLINPDLLCDTVDERHAACKRR